MKHNQVGSVMTTDVVRAAYGTPEIALSMTRRIDGVVGVVDRLSYRLDDASLRTQEEALHGVADDWLRKM